MARLTLDYLAAKTAQAVTSVIGSKVKNGEIEPTDVDNLATKALGVLQSQGVYAMFLFLLSRSGDKVEEEEMKKEERVACELVSKLWPLREPVKALLEEEGKAENGALAPEEVNKREKKREILEHIAKLTEDLDTLLLVRDLYEQTLIYTRFGAKAAKAASGSGSGAERTES